MGRGCSVIPKSVTPSRIISNFELIQLEKNEFEALEQLTKTKKEKRLVDPSPFWGVDIYKSKL
jgi:diketogulonate reductase-like aldo/keto reductase